MQFSIGIEYALHCLLYLIDVPADKAIGIKDLAKYQGVSETYLSKVFTRLRKAGIIDSVPGVNGGYKLARHPADITFLDVVDAIEGKVALFQCSEIRQKEILLDQENIPDSYTRCPCTIKLVMDEAEDQMRQYLNNKTLDWLYQQVKHKVPKEHLISISNWFSKKR